VFNWKDISVLPHDDDEAHTDKLLIAAVASNDVVV
jgi:hypothetical protein